MTREGVENGAKIPESAVPHWEGHGWVVADPPPKPGPITPAEVSPDPVVEDLLDDAPPIPADPPDEQKSSATTKTQKPSSRRKED